MSFDLIPADLILKIFHQLPFKDRVRLSGVSRLFRDVSMESIAKMKSMVFDDDREASSALVQKCSSLLESCSLTLESIDIRSCSSSLINALVEFVYPKLENLKITVRNTDNGQMNNLISRCPNLRSIVLNLYSQFEWPDSIVFEKMEKLEIYVYSCNTPTLRPLIGKVPNLKLLTIEDENFTLSVQEFSQLLASTPYLEQLRLRLSSNYENIFLDVHLPKLITFFVNFNCLDNPFILHRFPTSFPRLESITSYWIRKIDDPALMALSQLKYFQELRLPNLELTKEKLTKMVTALPSMAVLEINRIDIQAVKELSQLGNLRELYLMGMNMTKAQIIDLINTVPWITILKIREISDASSSKTFNDFLMSTAATFRQDLEIRVSMSVCGSELELENVLEELGNNGGPKVSYHRKNMNSLWISSIRYKSLDG